ncbi:Benzoate transport, ATPase component [Rhodovulum sp. PH10]|uniref:ABC transporter ATP-binding protein n=1 Tax=Rhodovulum sp. PH10 TaxID=1187851 RepID=UPI00027C2397|nr:ABC transporter ATP-binding protein [Rhodovulum sp. PH10]EJW11396.1 Benzoate transport, ATPase component [Rhodovulum sp. PH10]
MPETILETRDLSRRFGGLRAVSAVSLAFERGVVHAILGPNGAGKTTLINMLSGDLPPTDGKILFEGADVTGLPVHVRARRGIGRSYQKTNILPELTCLENCWLGAQARLPGWLNMVRPARRYRDVQARAERALGLCGLEARAGTQAATLSHGEMRQLEIGMMLATEPRLLLLDEPLAGMGVEESWRVIDLLKTLARDHTLILIEHDMDAVFSIAQRITVMVNGCELETGTPEQIRTSVAVRDAYLGEELAA